MRSVLVVDQWADISCIPPEYQSLVRPKLVNGRTEWIYPKGTAFTGLHAVQLVKTGQANPDDEECAKAANMTEQQLSVKQRENLAAIAGIKGKEDHELFMAGVIEGYDAGTTDDSPIYIHGPNWELYQSVLKTVEESEE